MTQLDVEGWIALLYCISLDFVSLRNKNSKGPSARNGKQINKISEAITPDDLELEYLVNGQKCPCLSAQSLNGKVIVVYDESRGSGPTLRFSRYFNVKNSDTDIKITELQSCQ